MEFEMILEQIYHISGIISAVFFLIVVYILKKEKSETIRPRIFLNYEKFRVSFYILGIGAFIFAVGNILGYSSHAKFQNLHEIAEVLYNLSVLLFGILFLAILKPKPKG